MQTIEIQGRQEVARTESQVSIEKITSKDIQQMPSIGGQADLAQYIQVLPGVVFSGDQGGQLYIRGGSAIHNKVLLDGMVVYNPFHSIGLFSVFETDIIRNADIYTGGFSAQYGGRISSVMDITTKDGNKKQFSGKLAASTFGANLLLEGPLLKKKDYSLSYILSAKNSYLSKTSTSIYSYMNKELPYDYLDLYGKLTLATDNGSKINIFGLNFTDKVNQYEAIQNFNWVNRAFGTNFLIIPGTSSALVEGVIAYSDYTMNMNETTTNQNQMSNIGGFNVGMSVTNFFGDDRLKYGMEMEGNTTKTSYKINDTITDYSTEIGLYAIYKLLYRNVLVEPSLRLYVKVTDSCNANCKFCANESCTDFGKVDLSQLEFVIRYLKEQNRLHSIGLTGGEPMINPDKLNDILNLIWSIDKNIQVQISTNGLNLREIAGFDDPNNLESIHISRHHYDDKKNIEISEDKMNEIIPVNGSMPAYLYYFVKAFIDAAVEEGIDYEVAKRLACESVIGSSKMILETNKSIDELIKDCYEKGNIQFTEMTKGRINPTEVIAAMINQKDDIADGIKYAQDKLDGSMSIMLLFKDKIIVARDKYGRTPVSIGTKKDGYCVSFENSAFINLGFKFYKELGPGEIVSVTSEKVEVLKEPNEKKKVCSFLWTYYGYPTSSYEGVGVETMRYKCGELMRQYDEGIQLDYVAGIPDSGLAHAIGYSNVSNIPFARPFMKYTPTWARSFMPSNQSQRSLVAHMKLIPVYDLIKDKKALLIDDSIVRGTQLRETVDFLYDAGINEVHVRLACPPIMYGCKYLNFSRSNSDLELIARKTICELEGTEDVPKEIIDKYKDLREGYEYMSLAAVENFGTYYPAEVIEKNSSCRGLCCVDTVKDTGWYGWALLFDQDGEVYAQYIRNSEPKGWKRFMLV